MRSRAMRKLLVSGLALSLLAPAAGAAAGEHRASPRFEGKSLPVPPHQNARWRPPETKLPKVFVTAAEVMFKHGLADPRGCEYRQIEVGTGSCWSGDAGVKRTHGWVLPAEPDVKQQFAVCWNGLVYPVVSVGEPANVRADVAALLEKDRAFVEKRLGEHKKREAARREEALAKGKKYFELPPHIRWERAWAEPRSVSHSTMLPVKSVLLLRLGHADLAEKFWSQWFAGREDKAKDDPYLVLATDWVWALFDRAVCGHMRGDDNLALVSARALVPIRDAVEAEATRRGLERLAMGGKKRPHLEFLGQLPDLLTDQERRAREPRRRRPPGDGLEALPKKERIAALIRGLDAGAARQWGQPGGVSIGEATVVKALVEEGESAVEPLLECLESDARLTRSVQFGRDFRRHRSIIGVHEPAYAALVGIIRSGQFGEGASHYELTTGGMAGRRAVAAKIRAYWKKHRGVPVEERWYRILADDGATHKQWLEAARCIVRPVDVEVTFGSGWVTVPHREPGEVPKLCGESLRGKKAPTVAELMAKRVDALSDRGRPGSEHAFAMHKACDIALCLARWDAHAALPTLRVQVRRCRERMTADKDSESWTIQRYASYIGDFTLARARGGDKAALDEHAEWIRTTTPQGLSSYEDDAFRPLWRHPDHPSVAEAVEWLFNDPASPWCPLMKRHKRAGHYHPDDFMETPLVGVAGFRRCLFSELSREVEIGELEVIKNGYMMVGLTGMRSYQLYVGEAAGEPGTRRAFSVREFVTWKVSALDGTPRCELYWPEERRERAIAACAAFLEQYGDRFRYSELQKALLDWPDRDKARMTFPRLGRPATAEDVRGARAIFTLEGEGRVRLWKMPKFPMKAKWVALKDYPRERRYSDPKTNKHFTRLEYEQDGLVWQAEELLKRGRWERYYGFAGKYVVAKVPAAEIEFSPSYPWQELSGGIDCRVCPPGVSRHTRTNLVGRFDLGGPFPVSLWLRNRKGVEQGIPSIYYRKEPGRGPELLAGVDPTLRYLPETVLPRGTLTPTAEDEKDWREIAPKVTARFAASGGRRTLAPAEEIEAFTLDLNDWFDVTKPGSYRLKFLFTNESGLGEAEGQAPSTVRPALTGVGESNVVRFSLAPRNPRKVGSPPDQGDR